MSDVEYLRIDGSYGEGGGQILRTALSLSVLLQRPVRIEAIRARRPKPGLQAQHLVALRAMAEISDAQVEGDAVGSQVLSLAPRRLPTGGEYRFDVGATEAGGSAGSVSLVFQTIFLPLCLAPAASTVTLVGGTHVAWSPPFHHLRYVFLPAVSHLGFRAELEIEQWGWYPRGGGTVHAAVFPRQGDRPDALDLTERGRLTEIWGFSAASSLPDHIIRRQRQQALEDLRKAGLKADIEEVNAPSAGPGTAVFLLAQYERIAAGFVAYGALRKPAERVASEAVRALVKFHRSKAAVEPHLADQLLLLIVVSGAEASFTTSELTAHLSTNAWVIEQFLGPLVSIEPMEKGARVTVRRGRQHV